MRDVRDDKSNDVQSGVSEDVRPFRHADYPIAAAFLNRWSPRAFSSEPVDDQTLMSIFEAARWAASSFNEQPWRFLMARSEAEREKFLSFLAPSNQMWAKHAPVLLLIVSKKTFTHNNQPNKTYHFDAGTASGYLALQASLKGLYAHGMAGFDAQRASQVLGIPEDFEPLAAYAIGYRGETESLPEELRKREQPSERRPVSESLMEGRFRHSTEVKAEADTKNETDDSGCLHSPR